MHAERDDENESCLLEEDNIGTRVDSGAKSIGWYVRQKKRGVNDPILMYAFKNENDAVEAMLELPYIHQAADTGRLVCTEPIYFGALLMEEDGISWLAVVGGSLITSSAWHAAKQSFEEHGGSRIWARPPLVDVSRSQPPTTPIDDQVSEELASDVTKVETRQVPGDFGETWTYDVYRAGTKQTALAFLRRNPVDGIYQE